MGHLLFGEIYRWSYAITSGWVGKGGEWGWDKSKAEVFSRTLKQRLTAGNGARSLLALLECTGAEMTYG